MYAILKTKAKVLCKKYFFTFFRPVYDYVSTYKEMAVNIFDTFL